MNTERDKFLTEAMDECWHKWVRRGYLETSKMPGWLCINCNNGVGAIHAHAPSPLRNDFSTPDGFFKLWGWAQKQEWWNSFVYEYTGVHLDALNLISLINPDRFSNAIYEFLKDK